MNCRYTPQVDVVVLCAADGGYVVFMKNGQIFTQIGLISISFWLHRQQIAQNNVLQYCSPYIAQQNDSTSWVCNLKFELIMYQNSQNGQNIPWPHSTRMAGFLPGHISITVENFVKYPDQSLLRRSYLVRIHAWFIKNPKKMLQVVVVGGHNHAWCEKTVHFDHFENFTTLWAQTSN